MPQTTDITIPAVDWIDVGLISGVKDGIMHNSGGRIVKLVQSITKPDNNSRNGFNLLPNNTYRFLILKQTTLWAKSNINDNIVTIVPQLGSTKSVSSKVVRQAIPPISTTLFAPALQGATSIDLVSSAGFVAGANFRISENGISDTYTYTVPSSPAGNKISIDAPLSKDYSTAAIVEIIEDNMTSVAGTLTNPVIYSITPPNDEDWKLTSFVIELTHAAAGDNADFGDIPSGLINGVVFRGVTDLGDTVNISNFKTNGDIALISKTFEYHNKSGQGAFGTRGYGEITTGIENPDKLFSSPIDSYEILIQDDITSLTSMIVFFKGIARIG